MTATDFDEKPAPLEPGSRRDFIGMFTRHRTAANLLMLIMVIAGIISLQRMTTQFFPDFGIDIITVSVEWPGASASDVDDNIVQALEPAVRFIDGIKRVRSSSFEGRASIVIEFLPGTDMQSALSKVETAVKQVTTLPADAKEPTIQRIVRYETLSRLLISGPYPEQSLKQIAKRIRDELLRTGIDKVDVEGGRDEEVLIEIRPEVLRRLNLTLDEVAATIRAASQDVPSGDLSGRAGRQIRSLGLRKTARDFETIEVKSLPNGQKIFLRDIARVTDAFDDDGRTARYLGKQAIELHIQRSLSGDALVLARKVDQYLEKMRPTLPPNLSVTQYDVQANLIRSRISLLVENGLSGLALVLVVLFIFLNVRVAFFVMLGIPISLMATMLIMWLTGQSINMVSLFALIMAIGIIVDDAIVVGEHSETLRARGLGGTGAAESGARRMIAPVMAASLTTVGSFLPLLVISDIIGAIIRSIPLVIIAVIVASLIECFFVLPGHMREAFAGRARKPWFLRRGFDAGFAWFRDKLFRALVTVVVRWRYVTIAVAIASLIASLGLIAGGRVGFVFFSAPETDKLFANVQFTAGTPRERTIRQLEQIERALRRAATELAGDENKLVRIVVARVGTAVGEQQGQIAMEGDHVGGLIIELVPTDQRGFSSDQIIARWQKYIERLPGIEGLTLKKAQGGPPGRDVDVRVYGNDPGTLKKAASEIRQLLARVPGVFGIEDDLPYGKREVVLTVTPRGRALGFNTESVGRQVRNAFEGAIAKRFARGDEEVVVRVQFPKALADSATLNTLYIRAPNGTFVPLRAVVSVSEKTGFARIRREDGRRQVAITADIDTAVSTTPQVIEALEDAGIRAIVRKYGLEYRYAGRAEEQATTFADMRVGAIVGLAIIYIVLAWIFASYSRPIVVMAVIPFGLIGTIFGHYLLGYDLTILSLVALLGLSGIVVNDSIILVSTITEKFDAGEDRIKAIIDGTCERLRAVLLTTMTTVGGLAPLLFETSLQARFLIPMALTIVFGLAVATFLVLFVVPALLSIQSDLGRVWRFVWPKTEASHPQAPAA